MNDAARPVSPVAKAPVANMASSDKTPRMDSRYKGESSVTAARMPRRERRWKLIWRGTIPRIHRIIRNGPKKAEIKNMPSSRVKT